MPIINGLGSEQLINATGISLPAVQMFAKVINSIYVVFGGIVGISIVFFLFRWRETYLLRKRIQNMEGALLVINDKLDAVLNSKRKKK